MKARARLLAIAAVLALAQGVSAQQKPANLPIIGWLSPVTAQTSPAQHLRAALAKQGLVEGVNFRFDIRFADGDPARLPELANALVRSGVNVILASGEQAARAAQAATKTVPIVTGGDDLVGAGIVASLSKPGGNTTGVSIFATELDAKKLEVLTELLPGAKRFGVLNDPGTSGPLRPQAMANAARALGLELQTIDVTHPDDIEPAFRSFQADRAQAVNIVASAMLMGLRPRLGELSIRYKIPAICQWREMVQAGCLASYGVTLSELYALYGEQIGKLLKGAKPSELPVVQPTKFELTINLKTAKALGLTIPPAVLSRADEVIE